MNGEDELIRVVIADDHEVVRQGLCAFLRGDPSFDVVAQARDGYAAVAVAREHRADVVVMDIGLPGLDGVAATRLLGKELPSCRVVVLTMHEDGNTVARALRAGARGYVLKGTELAWLADAVRRVHRGEQVLDDALSELVRHSHSPANEQRAQITEREREVLKLVAEGYAGREIAGLLGISPKTVEKHRASLQDKLKVRTTAGLVRYAIKHGYVE